MLCKRNFENEKHIIVHDATKTYVSPLASHPHSKPTPSTLGIALSMTPAAPLCPVCAAAPPRAVPASWDFGFLQWAEALLLPGAPSSQPRSHPPAGCSAWSPRFTLPFICPLFPGFSPADHRPCRGSHMPSLCC